MKLFEFEAKKILQKYNISTPMGQVVYTSKEAIQIADTIKRPVVIKAQIMLAGRGKIGGINFAHNLEETHTIAKTLIDSRIQGLKVRSLLIEEQLNISKELFISIIINRALRCYTILCSIEGGVNIEAVAKRAPEKMIRYNIHLIDGFHSYEATEIARRMGFSGRKLSELATIIQNLYRITLDYDAELAEINPLVESKEGKFIAADARLIIDDNALYRHPELQEKALEINRDLTLKEIEAKRRGLSYIDLEGNIGIIGNGAGLVMATLDLVQLYGGKPANFLDIGGGASADTMKFALKIVLSKKEVDVLLINILGGITRCDEVAKGILTSLNDMHEKRPLVIRIVGTKEKEAKEMFGKTGIQVIEDLEEAVKKVVDLVKR